MGRQEENVESQLSSKEDDEAAKLAKAIVDVLEGKELDRKLTGSIMALAGCAAAAIVDLVIFVHLVFDDGDSWGILLVGLFFVLMCWQVSFCLSRALRTKREIDRKAMVRREMGWSPDGSGSKGGAWDAEYVSLKKGSRI